MIGPDFEALYGADADPWRVGRSFYERRKRDLLLAALAQPRYGNAWDPACGTGHLVARLAERCDFVLASDASSAAVRLTRTETVGLPKVSVVQLRLPAAPPSTDFDLLVIAEFLYYLDADDRAASLAVVNSAAAPGAEIVSVHWRHHPHDAWLSGATVQDEIASSLTALGWSRAVRLDDPDFVLATLVKPGPTE